MSTCSFISWMRLFFPTSCTVFVPWGMITSVRRGRCGCSERRFFGRIAWGMAAFRCAGFLPPLGSCRGRRQLSRIYQRMYGEGARIAKMSFGHIAHRSHRCNFRFPRPVRPMRFPWNGFRASSGYRKPFRLVVMDGATSAIGIGGTLSQATGIVSPKRMAGA